MVRNGKIFQLIISLVALSVLALLLISADSPAAPPLEGINAPDTHPNGCVDCQKKISDTQDYALNTGLKAVKNHPGITKIVKIVPTNYKMCHAEGKKVEALNTVVHKIHFQNPTKNQFMAAYNGACPACYKVDTATGAMSVKSGAENW